MYHVKLIPDSVDDSTRIKVKCSNRSKRTFQLTFIIIMLYVLICFLQ